MDSKSFVVGGRHAIAGVKKENEVTALIDYLKTLR
jgi:cytochrome c2